MRNQLDDAPGRVVEVDGFRIPVIEVEHVAEQLYALACPGERGVEPVAGDEQREVVEGALVLEVEAQARLADDDRVAVERQPEGAFIEVAQVEWRREGHLRESHEAEHRIVSWTRPGAPNWRSRSRSRA